MPGGRGAVCSCGTHSVLHVHGGVQVSGPPLGDGTHLNPNVFMSVNCHLFLNVMGYYVQI